MPFLLRPILCQFSFFNGYLKEKKQKKNGLLEGRPTVLSCFRVLLILYQESRPTQFDEALPIFIKRIIALSLLRVHSGRYRDKRKLKELVYSANTSGNTHVYITSHIRIWVGFKPSRSNIDIISLN